MHVPNKFRVRTGRMASDDSYGNNGAFMVRLRMGQTVAVMASDELGWEHVSVSRKDRLPTWAEMCEVKELFWSPEEWVVQFHPARSAYVNNHPNCLHLWRPTAMPLPTPPSILVGFL